MRPELAVLFLRSEDLENKNAKESVHNLSDGRLYSDDVCRGMNQMRSFDAKILHPHRGISRLLKNPVARRAECGWTHENASTSEVNENQNRRINPPFECIDGLCKKVRGNQCVHMRADKLFPVALGVSLAFVWNRVVTGAFKNISYRCQSDSDTQFLKFPVEVFVSPGEVFRCKLKNQVNRGLWRSRSSRFAAVLVLDTQPSPIGSRFDNQHHIGDLMIEQGTQFDQVGPLFLGRNNLGIINPVAQHSELIFQQLQPGIVSRHKKPEQKNENHVKLTRKTAHIRWSPVGLISLPINGLRGGLRFRTPRKVKEFVNLSKPDVSSHPKYESEPGKIAVVGLILESWKSSNRCTVRNTILDGSFRWLNLGGFDPKNIRLTAKCFGGVA